LLPALFTLLFTTPACIAWGGYVAGVEELAYVPVPGVAWFLFWLLLFNWMYVTITPGVEELERNKLPGTIPRLLCGILICGFALFPFILMTPRSLAFMPVSVGSVTCDFLMFYLGVQVKKNGWLESDLSNQMDIHPVLLLFFVITESAGMAFLLPMMEENIYVVLGLVLLSGVFCLDMSLLVLVTFQKYLNVETSMTKFFARAAYGVYLFHPLVVTGMTALYISICNQLGLAGIDPVTHGSEIDEGAPVRTESDAKYIVGWVLVNLASHNLVWPLAYGLTRLPVLKSIL